MFRSIDLGLEGTLSHRCFPEGRAAGCNNNVNVNINININISINININININNNNNNNNNNNKDNNKDNNNNKNKQQKPFLSEIPLFLFVQYKSPDRVGWGGTHLNVCANIG